MDLVVLTVKTSLILVLGMLAAFALQQRSAAVRHWILALAILCAATVPILGRLTPSWTMPTFTVPGSERGAVVDVSLSPVGIAATAITPAAPQSSAGRNRVWAAIMPLWLIGIAVNVSLLLIGMFRLNRLRSTNSAASPTVMESLERVAAIFRLRRPVALVRSTRPGVIVTWGVVTPKVVLPADVDAWPRERLDIVLAHEVAHITRGDWLVQIIAELCKAIYWFNPLFWIACARLRYESERACDDAVMKIGVASHTYASELLEIARTFGRHRQTWLPAPAMAARPSNLERRVRAMLNARLDRGPLTRGGRWASAFGVLALALPIATFAQAGFVSFSGTVLDPQDRVLPAATITVIDGRRDVKHETKTDRNGHFELVGLPAGDYTVEAKLLGFRTLTDTFTVSGQSLDRTLKMQVGTLQETISVVSDDGVITSAHQRGKAFAKPPNPTCAPSVANGGGGNVRPPRKIKDVVPGYPGANGNVELIATIGTDGSVVDVQVVKTDRPELGPAAIEAVRQWEFTSTLLNCIPIEVEMNVSVSFRQNR
jgi:beta-lactamase regulating signal transducer with metallopeptidase domain